MALIVITVLKAMKMFLLFWLFVFLPDCMIIDDVFLFWGLHGPCRYRPPDVLLGNVKYTGSIDMWYVKARGRYLHVNEFQYMCW